MTEYNITNDELLDYLNNELADDKRKEIAALLYQDEQLRLRFRDIQRIEALVREQYQYPEVHVSPEAEANIFEFMSAMITTIRSEHAQERERELKPVIAAIEANKKNESKVARKSVFSRFAWAAAIFAVLIVGIYFLSSNSAKPVVIETPVPRRTTEFGAIEIPGKDMDTVVVEQPEFAPLPDTIEKKNIEEKQPTIVPYHKDENVIKRPDERAKLWAQADKFDNNPFLKKLNNSSDVPAVRVLPRTSGYLPGDINHDGVVDVRDLHEFEAILLSGHAVNPGTVADLDKDGEVTLKDLSLLARRLKR